MSTSSDLVTYRNEVIHYLQSMAIKFAPFATVQNAVLRQQGHAVDDTDPLTWKYYRNLAGLYHAADEPMRVMSLDTQTLISFDRPTLGQHPRTQAAYRVGQPDYTALCQRYPHQVDLIRAIVYPVPDLTAAVLAEDFTILSADDGFLEADERAHLRHAAAQHLAYVKEQWYFAFLRYEPYFYATFWSQLWLGLAQALLAARVGAMHTAQAHSFHVWAHLTSHGIGDYRDILSRRASLFLYRNIGYLIANRGKSSNLTLLVDRLLTEQNVGLLGRVVYQHTLPDSEDCLWSPEFVSETVPTRYADVVRSRAPESMTGLTHRLFEAGHERDITLDHIEDERLTVASTALNTLPTKVLELQPLPVDRKYAEVLERFLLDTLVSTIARSKYQPTVTHTDASTGIQLRLGAKEALVLWHWCVERAKHRTPTRVPRQYRPEASFRLTIDPAQLPTHFTHLGRRHRLRSLIPVDALLADTDFPSASIVDPPVFSDLVGRQFGAVITHILQGRKEGDGVAGEALRVLFAHLTEQTAYAITLAEQTTYAQWFAAQDHRLTRLLASFEAAADGPTRFDALASAIIAQLVPIEGRLLAYAHPAGSARLYARLKQLFVQLCSYNVLFLDAEADSAQWLFWAKLASTVTQLRLTTTTLTDVMHRVGVRSRAISGARVRLHRGGASATPRAQHTLRLHPTTQLRLTPRDGGSVLLPEQQTVRLHTSQTQTAVAVRSGHRVFTNED